MGLWAVPVLGRACVGCVGGCLGVGTCLCVDVGNSNQKVLFGFVWGQIPFLLTSWICGLHHRTIYFPPPFILRNLPASF